MPVRLLLPITIAVLLLVACGVVLAGPRPADAASQTIREKWVFFGDSITAMTMDPGPGSFSARVQAQRPNVVLTQVNAGVSGMDTTKGVRQLPRVLSKNADAKYIGISLGTNDSNGTASTCYVSPQTFHQNYVTMIQDVLRAGQIPVIPTLPSAYVESCGRMVRDQILLLYQQFPQVIPGPDLWTHFAVGPDGTWASRTEQQKAWFPGIHPSTSGIDEYRQVWADAMVQRVYSTP